jgi:hypothetical protein
VVSHEFDNLMPTPSEDTGSPPGLLARNLACLGPASALVRDRLEKAVTASIETTTARDGAVAIQLADGTRLCSLYRPREEALRMLEDFDPAETACAVVLGFGAGHHVQALLERFKRTGLVVVYEPDLQLLKAVFTHVDCTAWLDPDRVVFIDDEEDRGHLAGVFSRFETQLVAGTRILEHPASVARLGERSARMGAMVADAVSTARMSMGTLLMRSAGTVRNELLNIDHYALGSGIDDYAGLARGRLGVVVSAGPSLRRNMHLLSRDGVRDRCVIVAAQTTLRPLLDAGIRPHFVAALDYHHISKRFYEGLTASDVEGVTLVALPQAHPVIADSWPGHVVWARAMVLEKVLGARSTTNQSLPSASTVAHLAYLFARHLGCDPVALIGQDLGFTDGVYYARGTAIDEVWSPELNPFNTIATMEWQRIVRHRGMLHRLEDVNGRSILTDEQMVTYLRRFESLFAEDAERDLTTIDASEGGVRKAHTHVDSLENVLADHATEPHGGFPEPGEAVDPARAIEIIEQLSHFREEVSELGRLSAETEGLLETLSGCLTDAGRSAEVFGAIDERRAGVQSLGEVFSFVDRVNQLGAFKRYLADRRINLLEDTDDPVELQRNQIRRDLVNVRMLQEATDEAGGILDDALSLMRNGDVESGRGASGSGAVAQETIDVIEGGEVSQGTVAALVPIDPGFGGAGSVRSLRETIAEQNVLQRTLERLGTSSRLDRILVLLPDDCSLDEIIDVREIPIPIEFVRCGASPFGPEHEAVIAARMFADRSWRGGIAGMTVFDEVLAAEVMSRVMDEHELAAAVLCGGDWPLVEVCGQGGVDELVDRWRESSGRQQFVFTQAPPGLGACLVGRGLMNKLQPTNRLATIGSMIGYRPECPEHDPIAREGNVTIDPMVRGSQMRAIFDSPRRRLRMRRALEPVFVRRHGATTHALGSREVVGELEDSRRAGLPNFVPRHTIIELCTGRLGSGVCSPHSMGSIQREAMTRQRFSKLISELGEAQDATITLGGVGDPLQHPDCFEFISMAREAGVQGIHVRTELQCGPDRVLELARSGVHAISIDINADTRATYQRAMGHDGFATVVDNMQRLLESRTELRGAGAGALALPWIVPRIQRRVETYEDVEGFYERWQRLLGTPVIDPVPPLQPGDPSGVDPLSDAGDPTGHMTSELFRRMTVLSDGHVPVSEVDLLGRQHIGSVDDHSLLELWRKVVSIRRQILREEGPESFLLRTYQP